MRVIGADAEQLGILTRDEALALAQEAGMDLVEIQPNGDPPVCRIMDYGKFKFEAQKKAQAAKKKQKQVEIKEVKFRPVTDVGDYQIKLRNMLRFLEEGDKVKVTIRFRGREMSHQDLGQNLAKKIQEDVGENGVVESSGSERYGAMYFLTKRMEDDYPQFLEILSTIRSGDRSLKRGDGER